ncbi:MAG TPA: shikimate dehydrogenase [Gemmatimonadales bacterium]|nr:shikimate dehydrogenase [Gemmatimonadales bacterium]
MAIGGRTRVFAILGDPVAQSLSPAMYNAAFRALGLDAVYVPLPCAAEDVPALVRVLTGAGGGGNVTVPHKSVAARSVEHVSQRVRTLGACNTFWAGHDGSRGENTDVEGVLEALDALGAPSTTWLVLGTGGAARAVVAAARERGACLVVRSRSAERAAAFVAWAGDHGVATADACAECEVVVNATPLGLHRHDPLPLEPSAAPGARYALDLVYRRGETDWVRACRAAGLRAADGRGMLVSQGAAAFRCWFPELDPPVELMRAAVEAALR